jgi:cell division protein FtsI/penicillin-binding protein 2
MRLLPLCRLFAAGCLTLSVSPAPSVRLPAHPAQSAAPALSSQVDWGQIGYDALENYAGAVIVVDPRAGRVLRRVSRGTDVRFNSSPFELSQVVTAYAALDAGIIREQTRLGCDAAGEQVTVLDALARHCPAFFAEVSRRLKPAAFRRAAQMLGFTYYGTEERGEATRMRPVTAKIPATPPGEQFAALAVRGAGLEAEDLHFAQLASSLASGVTAAELLANYVHAASRGAAPMTTPLNRQALETVRRGLVRAVDDGAAKAAAHIDYKVAGKAGGDGQAAIFVSFAPADAPEVALVVYLKDALPRDAAEVAGHVYRACLKPR